MAIAERVSYCNAAATAPTTMMSRRSANAPAQRRFGGHDIRASRFNAPSRLSINTSHPCHGVSDRRQDRIGITEHGLYQQGKKGKA